MTTRRAAPLLLALLVAAAPLAAAPRIAAAPHPGAVVYREVCQACHMANGKGGEGAGRITALAGNANLAVAAYPITVVTGGKGGMPWFRGDLTDQQIADVVTYVRQNFGNRYKGKVTLADVTEYGIPAPKGADR